MSDLLNSDLVILKTKLSVLHVDWEGKASILEMKQHDFQWRQMEWWAFYFELQARKLLSNDFQFPGDKEDNVSFDMKRNLNWDLKAKAIKSDSFQSILNDKAATDKMIARNGSIGLVIALCDVEYNDVNRTFQKWHSELKGGKSNYEKERETRTAVSRYRKTHAKLSEILFLELNEKNITYLDIHRQGRNSNGNPRAIKYLLDFDQVEHFLIDKITF